MPGAVVCATSQQINSLKQRRVRSKCSRILEDPQCFLKTLIIDLELPKLEKTFGQRWQLRVSAPQLAEYPQCVFATPGAKFASRQIPLRQSATWLEGIVSPLSQLLIRRRPLGPIQLIEFLENRRQFRVCRMMLHEILQGIIPRLRHL